MLKWSHMKQPERRDCSCGCHMPQEPLKLFQWYHIPASEGTQAVQHCLGTLVREACRHTHLILIILHTEKRDSLHRGELALFPVDPKPPLAKVPKHQVPVIAQLLSGLGQDRPIVEVVGDSAAHFPKRGKGALHDLRKGTGRQGEPKGEDSVLPCPTLERKP